MKQVEVKITLRNNLMKERRLERGLTQGALAQICRIPIQYVCNAESFKKVSFETKQKIADALDARVEEVFPEEFERIQKATCVTKTEIRQLEEIAFKEFEKRMELDDIGPVLDKSLAMLTEREAQIIRLRFGIGTGYPRTLEDLGRIFSVTHERVRQIEAKAIRKLRHPKICKELSSWRD